MIPDGPRRTEVRAGNPQPLTCCRRSRAEVLCADDRGHSVGGAHRRRMQAEEGGITTPTPTLVY